MAEVARPDSFYVEELDSVFGPFQILKYRDAIKEATPLPKLLICESNTPDLTIKTIWNPFLDKWTNHGDVALLNGRGQVRVVLCGSANANTLLVTERCDNLCLFCSQPPRDVDDTVLFAYAAQSIVSFGSSDVIGISGGEPLLDKKAILNVSDKDSPYALIDKYFPERESYFYQNRNKLFFYSRNVLNGITQPPDSIFYFT